MSVSVTCETNLTCDRCGETCRMSGRRQAGNVRRAAATLLWTSAMREGWLRDYCPRCSAAIRLQKSS